MLHDGYLCRIQGSQHQIAVNAVGVLAVGQCTIDARQHGNRIVNTPHLRLLYIQNISRTWVFQGANVQILHAVDFAVGMIGFFRGGAIIHNGFEAYTF